jgi:ABC-type Fe3+-siderophore transport system permease subunit
MVVARVEAHGKLEHPPGQRGNRGLQVRGPRVLAALVVGAALAAAGTRYQGMFRNPLVSPDILGVSTGAALGAVLAIFFSQGSW